MRDFTAYVHKRAHTNIFAILLTLGITGLVGWVTFMLMQKNLASNMKDKNLDMICLAIFGFFTSVAMFVYFNKRFKVAAGYYKGEFSLEVYDPSLPEPLIIKDPYLLKRQWVSQYMTAYTKATVLYLTVFSPDQKPLVTFTCTLGKFHSPPMNFEYAGDKTSQLVLSEKMYDLGRTQELSGVLSRHLDKVNITEKVS